MLSSKLKFVNYVFGNNKFLMKRNTKNNMSGDAEVELLPDDLRLFSGYFWQILANPGYFLATVWLILATLG